MAWNNPYRKKGNPYGRKKIDFDGHSFASKFEAAVYQILKLRERAGEITDLHCQVQVRLTDAGVIYKPDFSFTETATGKVAYAEAKGFKTPEWKLKLRLWRQYGPGKLEIWEGTYVRPKLTETVTLSQTRDVCPRCQSEILDEELGLKL